MRVVPRSKRRSYASLITYSSDTTKLTMKVAYAVITSGTWILIQYDCSAGTGGMYPSFHVVA